MFVCPGTGVAGRTVKLNLGSGGRLDADWVHVDRAGPVDVTHDLTDLPLPFETNSCEGAVAHHVLDQLTARQITGLVGDVHRILAPGALFRISSADLDAGIDAALHNRPGWFPEPHGTLETMLGWFITDGGARKTRLSADRLRAICETAGFAWSAHRDAHITFGPAWLTDLDGRETESFYVEAAK